MQHFDTLVGIQRSQKLPGSPDL